MRSVSATRATRRRRTGVHGRAQARDGRASRSSLRRDGRSRRDPDGSGTRRCSCCDVIVSTWARIASTGADTSPTIHHAPNPTSTSSSGMPNTSRPVTSRTASSTGSRVLPTTIVTGCPPQDPGHPDHEEGVGYERHRVDLARFVPAQHDDGGLAGNVVARVDDAAVCAQDLDELFVRMSVQDGFVIIGLHHLSDAFSAHRGRFLNIADQRPMEQHRHGNRCDHEGHTDHGDRCEGDPDTDGAALADAWCPRRRVSVHDRPVGSPRPEPSRSSYARTDDPACCEGGAYTPRRCCRRPRSCSPTRAPRAPPSRTTMP